MEENKKGRRVHANMNAWRSFANEIDAQHSAALNRILGNLLNERIKYRSNPIKLQCETDSMAFSFAFFL